MIVLITRGYLLCQSFKLVYYTLHNGKSRTLIVGTFPFNNAEPTRASHQDGLKTQGVRNPQQWD